MRFKKKHYRPQVDTRDCGVAALAEVLNEDNFYILENIFRVKEVPLELMTKLDTKKDDLAADYERKVLPQISNQDREEFEYIFDYNQRLFNELFEKYQKYDESR
ncbi:hypothetical protein NQZ89_11815 (plasmid) [Streptococcus suis]|uniref:hypothetical protein n=1 Tax=Streptococcus suis TaxID=1307 RepID=UPI00211BB7D5|nr:hypothetical protein [Streptococcus suis]UUM58880.1 hypothetical protein NQZ91_11035 [Streptococcus suis]UUM63110.1 hypothetical protein NQZ89_11815 [Streptococcus suis]